MTTTTTLHLLPIPMRHPSPWQVVLLLAVLAIGLRLLVRELRLLSADGRRR